MGIKQEENDLNRRQNDLAKSRRILAKRSRKLRNCKRRSLESDDWPPPARPAPRSLHFRTCLLASPPRLSCWSSCPFYTCSTSSSSAALALLSADGALALPLASTPPIPRGSTSRWSRISTSHDSVAFVELIP